MSTRTTIGKGIVVPDGTIEPVRFTLLVPEPSAAGMAVWGIFVGRFSDDAFADRAGAHRRI